MKPHLLFICAASVSLTACASPASLFAGHSKEPSPIEMANAYVPVIHPIPADFCRRVGLNAGDQARLAGFDTATQERLTLQNTHQCERFSILQVASL